MSDATPGQPSDPVAKERPASWRPPEVTVGDRLSIWHNEAIHTGTITGIPPHAGATVEVDDLEIEWDK